MEGNSIYLASIMLAHLNLVVISVSDPLSSGTYKPLVFGEEDGDAGINLADGQRE